MVVFMRKIITYFVVLGILSGCAADGRMTKEGMGTATGAVGGALVGSLFGKGGGKFAATAAGAIAGAMIGNSIGKSMDAQDAMMMRDTSQKALEYTPTGTRSEWKNPDNGNRGSITPTSTYQNKYGAYCREYTQEVLIGGEKQKAYGRACREADGSWRIVE